MEGVEEREYSLVVLISAAVCLPDARLSCAILAAAFESGAGHACFETACQCYACIIGYTLERSFLPEVQWERLRKGVC